jgi:hypothetical protein
MACSFRQFSSAPRWKSPELVDQNSTSAVSAPRRPQIVAQEAALPTTCPGCGALTQLEHREEAGFYSLARPSVKTWTNRLDTRDKSKASAEIPYCNRCNDLVNHNKGTSVVHPAVDDIDAIIKDSPYQNNHIYHVLDAADFPMSLVKNLDLDLTLGNLRSRNRRAKEHHWHAGGKATMSFIITRADLLAPKEEQVNSLLPKLVKTLRKALGPFGDRVRLGNVRLVSTTRGWWTRKIKEDIWKESGAHWLVGKVNVGKSMLFKVIYPGNEKKKSEAERLAANGVETVSVAELQGNAASKPEELEFEVEDAEAELDEKFSLLPPPQPLQQWPAMPIASHLPGTTASPIRIRFGKITRGLGRGELIDLPGLERSTLENHVIPEHRPTLVMTSRVTPERVTLRAGSSIIFGGGLIRIAPVTEDLVFMVHSFLPLTQHVTATEKVLLHEQGEREIRNLESIVLPESKNTVKSAGKFRLTTDVTRAYSGPLTRKSDVGLKVENLPFAVYATDILVEGVGWIEVVAQVRKPKRHPDTSSGLDSLKKALSGSEDSPIMPQIDYPEIEVFSPNGRFIGNRESIGGYALGGPKPVPVRKRPSRPRKSMVRVKRSKAGMLKKATRETNSQ